MRSQSQLARLLRLVPYLSAHPGIQVAEAAEAFGTTPEQIVTDVEVLQFCGLPGGFWDDLFDVDIDTVRDEGRIELHNADVLSRPLRLRPEEAASLLAALRLVVDVAGAADSAASALAKLEAALGTADERLSVSVAHTDPEQRAALTEAIDQHRLVELTYKTSGRRGTTTALVEPAELRLVDGWTYLEAWSRSRDAWRSYRLDRIESVDVTEQRFEPRPGERPNWFSDAGELTLTVTAKAAWIAEYYPTTLVEHLPEGRLRVRFPVASKSWAAALLLRLGPEVLEVSDPAVSDAAAASARAALEAYRRAEVG